MTKENDKDKDDEGLKAEFVPAHLRANDAASLSITEIETLERLVQMGEMILWVGHFTSLEALIRTGYAVGHEWIRKDLYLVVPTPKGERLASIREEAKLKRMEQWKISPAKS